MTSHRTTISCLTLCLFVTACDLGEKSIGNTTGADNGDGDGDGDIGDGDGDGDAGDGPCGEETLSIVVDQNAELPGFGAAAADYLSVALGTRVGEFSWLPNDGPLTVEHAGTTSPLTVTVTYEGGEIRLTEVELLGQLPSGEGPGDLCGNQLEIDVTLGFATEDGLFAETFAAPLRVNSHSEAQQPDFYFSLDADALAGQLSFDDFVYEGGEIRELGLMGNFAGDLLEGGLWMEVLTMDWVGFGSVANFEATPEP